MMRRGRHAVTGILGKKIGMTQSSTKGRCAPITVLQQALRDYAVETLAKDGYEAAQIGLVEFVKAKNVTSAGGALREDRSAAGQGHQGSRTRAGPRGNGCGQGRHRFWWTSSPSRGLWIVIGTSKGRGFAGVVRMQVLRRTQVARTHVPGAGFDRARAFRLRVFPGQAYAGQHGRGIRSLCQSSHSRHRPRREIC